MGLHKISVTADPPTTDDLSDAESGSASDDDGDEETWDDWVSDAEPQQCLSLFEDIHFASAAAALEEDRIKHGFDLDAVCKHLALDFHNRIRLINYIRKDKPSPADLSALTGMEEFFVSDAYLVPVIEDDPLLQMGSDDWSDDDDDLSAAKVAGTGKPISSDRRIKSLERNLAQAKQDLADYRKVVESRFSLSRLVEQLDEPAEASATEGPKPRDDDSHYFSSYGENDIHAVMIQDKVRTSTYASFILKNPTLFHDAIVLDVGCGTGILSLFAARAGAKRVIAVDASDVAERAQKIVKANGLENVITVIRGKVEDVQLPEDIKQVDVIISEWMGYALLYESMLDSVLHARDRFLRPGGVMVPSQCQMMLGLCTATDIYKERIQFWSDVYGFDLSAMAVDVFDDAIADIVGPETMVSESVVIKELHLPATAPRQLDFTAPFTLHTTLSRRTTVHAFLLYFHTFFTTSGGPIPPGTEVDVVKDEVAVAEVWRVGGEGRKPRRSYSLDTTAKARDKVTSFSTGPKSVPTHWKQTIFLLREPIAVEDGTVVSGEFHCRKSKDNSRELDVEIHYSVQHPEAQAPTNRVVQTYKFEWPDCANVNEGAAPEGLHQSKLNSY